MNSWELAARIHLPPGSIIESRRLPVKTLEILPPPKGKLLEGTPIGAARNEGIERHICIPEEIRRCHTHIIGRTGAGKSNCIEHMVLHDIRNGSGVVVLDPHGDTVERLVRLIPEKDIERTIYFDPSDPDWVPLWNPISLNPGQDIYRTTADLVAALKGVVEGWGDRLEHLLRNAFLAVLHLPNPTLLDVSNLLMKGSPVGDMLRADILSALKTPALRNFWECDFKGYRHDELAPPKHKLSKLLLSGTVSLMLSQAESRINISKIMEEGQILLVNLGNLGSQVREVLGCFLLALLHIMALKRSSLRAENRRPFHIYCDEAHRFVTDALEDIIAETRKFAVSLTLAHHYMRQFKAEKADALATVGSTIIFNVDSNDARYLLNNLREEVEVKDIVGLGLGEAVARIGTEIVKIKTFKPQSELRDDIRERIIGLSHERYYKPISEILQAIRQPRGARRIPARDDSKVPPPGEFYYEELE